MRDDPDMNRSRRNVLQLAGALAAASATGGSVRASAVLEREMGGLFADQEAAAAIGYAYLRTQPKPGPTLASLQNAVLGDLEGDAARFRACVRRDFDVGRIVMVDGWTLSRVEAQACALAYLSIAGGA